MMSLSSIIVCPSCFEPLSEIERYPNATPGRSEQARHDALWACDRCDVLYPVLGGIPILTLDPADWLATYWDAALAALAEAGRIGPHTVSLAKQIAMTAAGAEQRRFGDDWVAHERDGLPDIPKPPIDHVKHQAVTGQAAEVFYEWMLQHQHAATQSALNALGSADSHPIIEVGPGAGNLTAQLAKRGAPVVVIDISLRSVLISLEAAGSAAATIGIVADAQALPIATHAAKAVMAINMIDLLEKPEDFLASAHRVLAAHGDLVITTPRPDLNRYADPSEDEQTLSELVAAAGFDSVQTQNALPWLRAHHSRHYEIYWVMLLSARRAKTHAHRKKSRTK